ncbi:MAG TPA: site-2 protease family protein [Kofleriaceae bacterium]|nr:site-2 protease family protein [Kofleriaceae bacterium]
MAPQRSWWTWNLGRIAGIPIRVHVTLLVLLAWIASTYALRGAGFSATAIGVGLVAAIFVVIVVHELGHALVARRFGIKTRDIMLLPIGGIASLEHMPDKPRQELAVAAVGPLINLVIAAILYAARFATDPGTLANELVSQMIYINVGLAVFNLIPAFPMDGGRVLRSLLAMRMGPERATNIAASMGKLFAVAIGILGLFSNPLLLVIAFVVWSGAQQERAMSQLKHALAGVPVSAAMLRRVEAVTPDQPLEDAASLLLRGGLNQLPVIDHGKAVGVITRSDVASALAHARPDATVATAPRHEIVEVTPADSLDSVLERLREHPDSIALVLDEGLPVGVLTAEHLAAYVALHQRGAA